MESWLGKWELANLEGREESACVSVIIRVFN